MRHFREIVFHIIDITKEIFQDRSQARFYLKNLLSVKYKYNSLKHEMPWITYGSIEWIEKYLSKDMRVFEWGSGGSTIFFARRVREVVSIEHDYNWYIKVKKHLKEKNLNQNVEEIFKKPQKRHKIRRYKSINKKYKNYSFKEYCLSISKYPDEYFDLILVDGRARADCMKEALKKVKKGGCIVLDNSERKRYWKNIKNLQRLKRIDFKGIGPLNSYSWQTTIFTNSL
jgi:predicted O-methyltransferase YrrM